MTDDSKPSSRTHTTWLTFEEEVVSELPHSDAEVTVSVTALLPPKSSREEFAGRVNAALAEFHRGQWRVSPVNQRSDAGLERAQYSAITRIPLEQLHELEAKAKAASSEGLSISEPEVRFVLTPEARAVAFQALAVRAYDNAVAHAAAMRDKTGLSWDVNDVVCEPVGGPWGRPRREKTLTERVPLFDEPPTYLHRVAVQVRITLSATTTSPPAGRDA